MGIAWNVTKDGIFLIGLARSPSFVKDAILLTSLTTPYFRIACLLDKCLIKTVGVKNGKEIS